MMQKFHFIGFKIFITFLSRKKPILAPLGIKLPTWKNSTNSSKDCEKIEHKREKFRESINRKLSDILSLKKNQHINLLSLLSSLEQLSPRVETLFTFWFWLSFYLQLIPGGRPSGYLNPFRSLSKNEEQLTVLKQRLLRHPSRETKLKTCTSEQLVMC